MEEKESKENRIKNDECLQTTKCLKEVSRDDQAPLFIAEAYYRGKQVTIDLTEYLGKWVMLFFYSSNFTFV